MYLIFHCSTVRSNRQRDADLSRFGKGKENTQSSHPKKVKICQPAMDCVAMPSMREYIKRCNIILCLQ